MKRYGVSQRRAQPALRQTITRAKKVRNLTLKDPGNVAGADPRHCRKILLVIRRSEIYEQPSEHASRRTRESPTSTM